MDPSKAAAGKIPKGLEKILETCNSIYPDQKNPLQV